MQFDFQEDDVIQEQACFIEQFQDFLTYAPFIIDKLTTIEQKLDKLLACLELTSESFSEKFAKTSAIKRLGGMK